MNNQGKAPLVSVVTLNYNGKKFLKGLFDSLRKCTYPNLEIIMVDNCSQDDSVKFVRENYPEVKILENPENFMYAGGNNRGLKVASGEYICLINNDVDVDPHFVEPIVNVFENNPQMAAGQPKILGMQQRDHLEYAGACGGFIDWLGYPFVRGRLFFTTEKDDGQYDEPTGLFWASGACIFLRKKALEEVGYFDENFVLHMEEIDLCWRIRLYGWDVFSMPQSRIWHHVGGTLDKDNPRKTYWNFRNNIFLLIKNLSLFNLLIRLPIRIPLDFLAFFIELVKGHFANAMSVAKAYTWIVAHLSTIMHKRREVQRRRSVADHQILKRMYPGSIVFEYFILGRRTFSELQFSDKILHKGTDIQLKKELFKQENINAART